MAVMDFRDGGFGFTRSRQRAQRDHDFEQNGWDGFDEDQGADTRRFSTGPADEPRLGERLGRLTHYVGAVVSVGLMVGLMIWGWQLVSRDVSGIPVIKALQGDARTTPEDPGGELTNHTGFAVNEVTGGQAATPSEQVALAPDNAELAEDDIAMGELGATAHEPLNISDQPVAFDSPEIMAMTDGEAAAAAEAAAREAELAAAAVQDATIIDAPASEGSVSAVLTDEAGTPVAADAITAALAEAQQSAAPVLRSSARPVPRPRRVASVASSQPAAAAPAPASRAEAAAAPAPAPVQARASASGPLVQIGAFDSDAIAQSEWGRVSGKYGSLFSGKGPVIAKHKSNGRTFWRLRVAGFDSLSEARQFCAALKSGGTDCLALGQ